MSPRSRIPHLVSRRALLTGMGASLSLVGLVACGAGTAPAAPTPAAASKSTTVPAATAPASTAGSPTVVFWSSLMGSKEPGRKAVERDFEKTNSGLKIQHQGFFDIMQNNEKLLTAMVAGNPPDVVSNHYYFVANYAHANALVPLDPLMKQSSLSSTVFIPSVFKLGQWKGQTYGLPIYADTMGYFYNTDLFTKAGLDPEKPPATWQELIDQTQKLTVRENGKIVQSGMSVPQDASESISNMFYALLLAAGGKFLSDDGKSSVFNDAAGQQGLQLMVDLIHKYHVTEIGWGQGLSGAAAPFFAGKNASRYDIPPTIYFLHKDVPKLNYGTAPLPAGPKGKASPVLAFEMFIPKGSKNQTNAWKFIDFCMQSAEQVTFNTLTNHLACEPKALQSNKFFTTGKMTAFYDSLTQFSTPFPITPVYADILTNLQKQLQAAVLAKSDVKKALDTAATYANQQLASA